jgi:hypothetical protein
MVLDHNSAILWVNHGGEWSACMSRFFDGVGKMMTRNLEHLRHLAVGVAAIVATASFVGIAVLPAWVA